MEDWKKLICKTGALLAVIGGVVLILWATGVFKKTSRQTMREPLSAKTPLFNTYMLNPDDRWKYWDETGTKTQGHDIQRLVINIFATQNDTPTAEHGNRRFLIFLLPGVYSNLHIQVGYYTSVAGLGATAADTIVQGSIGVPNNESPCIGALKNNYRNISNLTIQVDKNIMAPDLLPVANPIRAKHTNFFRVSKGSPIRNIILRGTDDGGESNFSVSQFNGGCEGNYSKGGYASGGFMANVLIRNGHMRYGTQQQFFSRNCDYDIHSAVKGGGGMWNIYLLGCIAQARRSQLHQTEVIAKINRCPSNSDENINELDYTHPFITLKDVTPGRMASIPQIRYNKVTSTFYIIKPPLVNNSSGILDIEGEKLSDVFIVAPNTALETINKNLKEGRHLIFSPGMYHFAKPVRITRSGTVVMTLGYATLIPTAGQPALIIDSAAEGVRLSGFIFQAGKKKSKTLLLVGDTPRAGGSVSNPTIIYDVVCRVGGGQIEIGDDPDVANSDKIGTCETMVVVNQNHTIFDNIWCWRASHLSVEPPAEGRFFSKVDRGINVKGDRVRMFGVAVEHTLKEQVLWEGNRGELYFAVFTYPYDVFGGWDFPGLRVTGRHFKGSGLGVYSSFETTYNEKREKPAPKVSTAILTYNKHDAKVLASAHIESAYTVFLVPPRSKRPSYSAGSVESIINGNGPVSNVYSASEAQWCGTLCRNNHCKCKFPYSEWCGNGD